jgi:hypothetical protein
LRHPFDALRRVLPFLIAICVCGIARAAEPVWFWDTAAESSLGELKGRARLGPNFELLLDHGSFRSLNFEPIEGDAFSIQLHAIQFEKEPSGEILAWGNLKLGDFFPQQLPGSAHLALVFRQGEIRAFLDGKLIETRAFDFELGEALIFGEGWAGAIEGIEVYDHAIDPDTIRKHAAKIRTRIDARAARTPFRVEAKLIESTPIPDLAEIAPYREATIENVFEVVRHISGPKIESARIVVVRWAILDKQPLEPTLKVGDSTTLDLEPLSAHPQLRGGFRKRAHNELDAPAFFDIRSHEPTDSD